MLGLEYQSKRGYIGLSIFRRMVGIKIMPVRVHMGRLNQIESRDKEWMGVFGSESSSDSNLPKKSMLVVSAFIGCSPSLSGAIWINPWNVESEALNDAISMVEAEKQLRHEKHYRYVSTHDVAYWSRSFM
ncbi:hypothetical protein IFM89_027824 [Coptis chinensis]|uniref:Uncharacterized protein n=1 Tax=Coptis chinensis TaxID=261450 RepID=A0A835IYW5_9MAGN|nr:hypothetical protein IFM89_027824 [Coptis chinensis]